MDKNSWLGKGPKDLSKLVVVLFFALYLLVGSLIFADYGVSTDESGQDRKAQYTIDYVLGRNDLLVTYSDRHYGAIFPAILLAGKTFFPDTREFYFYRHFVNFLSFYLASILFYRLLRKLGYQWQLSLLGTLFLILQPQIFAHSFFNPKDIPFLSMFVLALNTLVSTLQNGKTRSLVLHGVVTGLLIVFRLPGLVMVVISEALLVWLYLAKRVSLPRMAANGLLYAGVSFASLYAFLPVLWSDLRQQLSDYLSMSPITWEGLELYFGKYYSLKEIPFGHEYITFAVQMPLVLLALFALGVLLLFKQGFGKGGFFKYENLRAISTLAILCVTLEVFLVQKPDLYNGWRLILFFYPIFLLVVVAAIEWLWVSLVEQKTTAWQTAGRWVLWLLLAGQALWLAAFLVISHPYEYIYYNLLGARSTQQASQNFELDYWGISYRRALEKILAADARPLITIASVGDYGRVMQNVIVLPPAERARLRILENGSTEKPDYLLDNYSANLATDLPGYKMIDSIVVDGAILNGTYVPVQ